MIDNAEADFCPDRRFTALAPDIPLPGDAIEALAKKVGADELAAWWTQKTGLPCGCEERKRLINDAVKILLSWIGR